MNWTQLPPKDAADFLTAVAGNGDAAFFDPSLCEIHKLPLSFYDGYELVRIVNKHAIPYLLLDYLSSGEQHYYLDGSERAFHNVNAQGAINLSADNVLDYLDLFISYVYERGNSLLFIHDNKNTFGAPIYDGQNDLYTTSLPLIYQDKEVQARVDIASDGKIFIREPIEVSFLTELHPDTANPYRHPHEAEIIEQARGLLSITKTGASLMDEMKDAAVRVLNSPNYTGFVTNGAVGYIAMPTAEQSAKYTQALTLASILRNIKQIRNEYIYAHPVNDKDLYTTVSYGKNLDILQELCKIIEEYEAQNIPEPLGAFEKMGFKNIYEAYKGGLRDDALMDSYIEALQSQGRLKDE